MSRIALGRELNSLIALHRKILYARVPSLPVSTWEMTHDLPIRSEKLHNIGSERFWDLFSINLQDNLQDLLLIASLHGQYDQNCLASIVAVLLPV